MADITNTVAPAAAATVTTAAPALSAPMAAEAEAKGGALPLFQHQVDKVVLNPVVKTWLQEAKEPPIVLLVCGAQGCGKSTFLNQVYTGKQKGRSMYEYNTPFATADGIGQVTKGLQVVRLKLGVLCEQHHLDQGRLSPDTEVLLVDSEGWASKEASVDPWLLPQLLAVLPFAACCCYLSSGGRPSDREVANVSALQEICSPVFGKQVWLEEIHALPCVLGMNRVTITKQIKVEQLEHDQREQVRVFEEELVPKKARGEPQPHQVFCYPQFGQVDKKKGVRVAYWGTTQSVLKTVLDHVQKTQDTWRAGVELAKRIEDSADGLGNYLCAACCYDLAMAVQTLKALFGGQTGGETTSTILRSQMSVPQVMPKLPLTQDHQEGTEDKRRKPTKGGALLQGKARKPHKDTIPARPTPVPPSSTSAQPSNHREFDNLCGRVEAYAEQITCLPGLDIRGYFDARVQAERHFFDILRPDDPIHQQILAFFQRDMAHVATLLQAASTLQKQAGKKEHQQSCLIM